MTGVNDPVSALARGRPLDCLAAFDAWPDVDGRAAFLLACAAWRGSLFFGETSIPY